MRGDGWVYVKSGTGRTPRWYVGYYRDGQEYREPATVSDPKAPSGKRPAVSEEEALKCKRTILRGLDRGDLVTPEKRRVTVGTLLDGLLLWMRNKGKRSADKVTSHLKPIRAAFGNQRAVALTSDMIERYKAERLARGKSKTTIDRELESLRRGYSWGAKQQPPLVASILRVECFKEENARQGFLSRADFEAILGHVKDSDLRDYIEWGFWTGMRAGEIAKLTWEMHDRETKTLRLHARAAKNMRGRVLVLAGPLGAIIERRLKARLFSCPLIFHRTSKGLPGQPIQDFRKAWATACKAVGIRPGRRDGITFHDTRRTAVRNLIRAGVDQTVAKKISGHRTDSMFTRYNITTEDDLREAVERVAAYVDTLPTERKVVGLNEGRK